VIVRRSLMVMTLVLSATSWAAAQSPRPLTAPPQAESKPARPAMLLPLYLSHISLHAADLYTTRQALSAGHREGNQLFNDASFGKMLGAKAAVGAASILISEKLWKRNRVAAVGTMIAANVGLSIVVAHNYQVLHQ